MITYLLRRLYHEMHTVPPLVSLIPQIILYKMQASLDIPVPQMKHLVHLELLQGQYVPIDPPVDLMTLFQASFDEDAKDHRGSNVTRDYINNYVITFVIGTYMYACISLVVLCDYIVVLWTVSVTHVTRSLWHVE